MIVCSCNMLTADEVRAAIGRPDIERPGQVYGHLDCTPKCGRCALTIQRMMDEARATSATPAE